jgi:colanic acid/amylovoran biosynthesis glycosyltransferase
MKKKIAYLLAKFPNLSETFILNEVCRMNEYTDIDLFVYSFRKPHLKEYDQATIAKIKRINLIYLPIYKLFINNLIFLFLNPIIYFKNLFKSTKFIFDKKSIFSFFVGVGWYYNVKNKKIEHLHSHFSNYSTLINYNLSKLLNIPYSFTSHAHDLFKNNTKNNLRELTNKSKFHITISQFNKRFLSKIKGINLSKINVIHCGIDVNRFKPMFSYKNKEYLEIVSVGRLVEKKGFNYLIDALSILNKQGVSFHCNIIGEGPEREIIQKRILDNNLMKKVFLIGSRDNEFVRKMVAKSSLFVLPCIEDSKGDKDGIPVSLMESMALGIPVISTKISGIPELIKDGKEGFLVSQKNSRELANVIKKYIKSDIKSLIENSRYKILEEFNEDVEVEKLHKLFTDNPLRSHK